MISKRFPIFILIQSLFFCFSILAMEERSNKDCQNLEEEIARLKLENEILISEIQENKRLSAIPAHSTSRANNILEFTSLEKLIQFAEENNMPELARLEDLIQFAKELKEYETKIVRPEVGIEIPHELFPFFQKLGKCIWSEDISAINLLLDENPDVNLNVRVTVFNPLSGAISKDNCEIAKLLINKGSNPNIAIGSDHETVSMYVKSAKMVKLLNDAGVNWGLVRNASFKTSIIQILVKKCINCEDSKLIDEIIEMIELIVESGTVSINQITEGLEEAKKLGLHKIIEFLENSLIRYSQELKNEDNEQMKVKNLSSTEKNENLENADYRIIQELVSNMEVSSTVSPDSDIDPIASDSFSIQDQVGATELNLNEEAAEQLNNLYKDLKDTSLPEIEHNYARAKLMNLLLKLNPKPGL